MSVLQKLTLRHLRQNRKRSIMTVIGIALSVAMVTAVSGLVVSFQDLLYRDSVVTEGLWHVRYANVSSQTAEQIGAEPVFSDWTWTENEEGSMLSLQFTKLSKKIFDQSEAVCQKYGIKEEQVRYHNNLLIAKGIVPGSYFRALYSFAAILLALIGVGSVLVISNAFAISSDQRSVQFGLLKSVGATGTQIRGMVLFEGIALLMVSIPLGIAGGFFAQWVALSITNRVLASMNTVNLSAWFRIIVSPAALGVAVSVSLVTVLLAAWFPARRAEKASAVEAIRQTGTVKLTRRQVRVFSLTQKLFGFEGMLAAKALRRSRGKYRATILALVVSIVLFIGVASFGSILTKATTLFYEDMESNVSVSLRGGTAEQHDALAAEMASWNSATVHPARQFSAYPELPDGALSADYLRYFPDSIPSMRLFGIGAEDYAALCRDLGLSTDQESFGEIPVILMNTSGTYIEAGRRINFVPFRLKAGDGLTASIDEQEVPLRIAASISEIPPGIYLMFSANSVNLILSDEALGQLWPSDREDALHLTVLAEDPDIFEQRAIALLEQQAALSWDVTNYERVNANNRNISALVMLFVYGFIAMLTLIGVTSVITTISTNIALRAREFAMLRSVGMTEPAIRKMLRYESLLYGFRALLWGIPLGLLVCWLLYRAMTNAMDFPFIWPVQSILISVAAILLITFTTMAFAWKRQRQINIVEVLRNDVA